MDHESLDCEAPFPRINCNQEYPSYSKNCEKWKNEKEIQVVHTKQTISYSEARKIVESRIWEHRMQPITVLNSNKKTYHTIETQTEFPVENLLFFQ